jgi:hypothetical protein
MDFIKEFYEVIMKINPNFDIAGFLTKDDNVYPLGTDTKVLSTDFELIARPIVYEIADKHGYQVYEPSQQNYYPDFTLMKSPGDTEKIAVDIKTTYREFKTDGTWRAKFTLGSYASFMRNGTKNIAFPYSHYKKHYIIGFIYTREEIDNFHVFKLEDRNKITYPIKDVEYFCQEKYKIADYTTGSGNTENIGSITASTIDDFKNGTGPFAELGEEVFHDYWVNFPRYREEGHYRNLKSYFKWIEHLDESL